MPAEKWFLNLVPDNRNKLRGAKMALVAKRKVFHKPGATRRKVQWTVTQNLNGLDPTILPDTAGTLDQDETTEAADRKFTNELDPGEATKVEYTITARKSSGGGNVAFDKIYETWRKVFYDVVYMEGTKPLYDGIKDDFIAAWAAVGFEFTEKRIIRALVNEATTDSTDAQLSHLYAPGALAEAPFHLRVVIVRDLVEVTQVEPAWRMTQLTPKGTGSTRVWSTGTTVHYESPSQVMAATPLVSGVVRGIGTVAVPDTAITRLSAHVVAIDMTEGALAAARATLLAPRKVSLKAKLRGAKSQKMELRVKLDHTSKNAQPLLAGSATIAVTWVAPDWVITLTDNGKVWAPAPVLVAKLESRSRRKFGAPEDRSDGTTDVSASLVRQSDHVLVLTVPDVHGAPAMLTSVTPIESGPPGGLRVHRLQMHLDLLYDAADTEDEVDVEVTTGQDDLVRYDSANDRVVITDSTRVFDAHAPLADAALLCASADVALPATQVTRNAGNVKQVDFDLQDPQLDVPRNLFTGGGTLEFEVTLNATQSIGGHSVTSARHFVALSTKQVTEAQTAATTRDRLLRCILHELGHAHGLVGAKTAYPSAGASKSNAKYYRDEFGGQGPHCAHNAKLAPSGPSYGSLPTTSGQYYKRGDGGLLCVMYHRLDHDNMSAAFCPSCTEQLRLASMIKFT